MTTKNLIVLSMAAVVLGGVAYFTASGKKMKTPSLVGKKILPAFNLADVATVDLTGDKPLTLAATDAGWVVKSLYDYPADVTKIRENLLKLQELKVGHVANGRTIAAPVKVALKNGTGQELGALTLGETHMGKPRGQMAQFGGGSFPDGRYVQYGDKVVLTKETLDAFDGDPKKWMATRIASVTAADVTSVTYTQGKSTLSLTRKDGSWTLAGLGAKEELDSSKTYSLDSALSYLDLTGVADPKQTPASLGLTTGAVYTATLKNGQTYTARLGATTGADRWVQLSASFKAAGTNATENAALEKAVKDFNAKTGKWVYSISSYNADNLMKTRGDLVKAKEEPKKDDAQKSGK
jgi:hypothetical protein